MQIIKSHWKKAYRDNQSKMADIVMRYGLPGLGDKPTISRCSGKNKLDMLDVDWP